MKISIDFIDAAACRPNSTSNFGTSEQVESSNLTSIHLSCPTMSDSCRALLWLAVGPKK